MPNIRSSADLRNQYNEISTFCHEYAEPVFITKNGKGDLAVMSIEAYEEREKMLAHRAGILAAEAERLAGIPSITVDEARARLKEKYSHA